MVAFHPTCHLELHEDKAYQRLHGLIGRTLGDGRDLLTLADLEAVNEPLAALLIELPQREIGGRLPEWDDLVAQVAFARDRGAALHLDGARLWEAGPFYDRPLAEIAAVFDACLVSFAEDLVGWPAACSSVAEEVVEAPRCARPRGHALRLWPYAASGLAGLRRRLPRMAAYVAHAQAIATALADDERVLVVPDPPQTPMMHLHLRTSAAAVTAGIRRMATEQHLWTWSGSLPTETPGYRRVELTVGEATLGFTPPEVVAAVRTLLPDRPAADED